MGELTGKLILGVEGAAVGSSLGTGCDIGNGVAASHDLPYAETKFSINSPQRFRYPTTRMPIKQTGYELNRKQVEKEAMESKKRKLSEDENKSSLMVKFSLSDVKNKYKDASLPPNWKAFNTIIFNECEGIHDTEKIAAFDFDGCLANTSVKRTGADAWSLMYQCIPEKLQELYNGGYKLVIFTNESNIERWKNKRQQAVDSKIGRLKSFLKLVKVPVQVFIACGLGSKKVEIDDPFRKPMPGMWNIMAEHFNSGKSIDMNQSFYVGDAAGRRDDHSDADIKFAKAVGLKFYVPEEFFIA